MSNPMEGSHMDSKLKDAMEKANALRIERLQKHPEFATERAPDATPLPSTTDAASRQASKAEKKKRPREFTTFIEESQPERDKE